MFKKGDIIIRINDDFGSIKVGDICTVKHYIAGNMDIELENHIRQYSIKNFRLFQNMEEYRIKELIRLLKQC